MATTIALEPSWKKVLLDQFSQPYMQKLKAFLLQQKAAHKIIYPAGADIFRAFELTPLDQVKVVIVGQDPYHGPNQAHGLCFSVLPPTPAPPSLINIFKELKNDLGMGPPNHGCLTSWAKQGVLLLNSVLTVEKNLPGSHQNQGWEIFTDQVIKILNLQENRLIFLLWGSYAEKKGSIIDQSKHFVLKAAHPSPFSAHRGFLGCKHFSKTNEILQKIGVGAINWDLSRAGWMMQE